MSRNIYESFFNRNFVKFLRKICEVFEKFSENFDSSAKILRKFLRIFTGNLVKFLSIVKSIRNFKKIFCKYRGKCL